LNFTEVRERQGIDLPSDRYVKALFFECYRQFDLVGGLKIWMFRDVTCSAKALLLRVLSVAAWGRSSQNVLDAPEFQLQPPAAPEIAAIQTERNLDGRVPHKSMAPWLRSFTHA
jgi:hypothetical protein